MAKKELLEGHCGAYLSRYLALVSQGGTSVRQGCMPLTLVCHYLSCLCVSV